MTRHQYGISALVSQTSFSGETSRVIAKCRLFSEATSRPWTVFFLSLEPLATSEKVKLCIKKLMVQKRKDWASALVPRAFPSHAFSRSTVTKKKNKRLLSVYSFLKTDFTVGKRPVTRAKGKTGCIHLYILTKRLSQLFSLPSGAHDPEQATRILGLYHGVFTERFIFWYISGHFFTQNGRSAPSVSAFKV